MCVAAAVAALGLGLGSAEASGLRAPNVGSSLSGPATVDPAAVFWSPGALGFIEAPKLMLVGGLLVGDVRYQRERRATYQREDALDFALPVAPELLDLDKTGVAREVSSQPVAPVPALFLAMPLGESGLVAGFGAYAPFAAMLDFGDEDGPQRWALNEALIAAVHLTPGLSWRVHERLSVGVSGSLVLGLAQLKRVQDFAALADVGEAFAREPIEQANDFGPDAPPGVRELDVMARPIELRDAWATSATFQASVVGRPVDDVQVGLSYHHETPMDFVGEFRLDMDHPFFTQDLASQGLQYKPVVEGDASLSFTLPRSVWLGAAWEIDPRFGVGLTAGWTMWSQLEAFDVRVSSPDLAQPELGLPETTSIQLPRRWQDTVALEVTGRYRASADVEAWLLGGYQSSASPNATVDVASPDGDRVVAGGGVAWQAAEGWRVMGDLEIQSIVPRRVRDSDFDLGNGEYRLTLLALGVYMEVELSE